MLFPKTIHFPRELCDSMVWIDVFRVCFGCFGVELFAFCFCFVLFGVWVGGFFRVFFLRIKTDALPLKLPFPFAKPTNRLAKPSLLFQADYPRLCSRGE